MGKTNIAWATDVWNPISGCTKVSPGCLHCYAAALDKRFHRDGPYVPWTVAAQRKADKNNVQKMHTVHLHPERLDAPLHWKRPRRIFVNSMSDLFHEDVPDEFIGKVFMTMAMSPMHTFQVLTKRPERIMKWFEWADSHKVYKDSDGKEGFAPILPRWNINRGPWPLPNVWLGVSVENQRYANERLPLLAQCPAAVRFVSAEPLLGPLDLRSWLWGKLDCRCLEEERIEHPDWPHPNYCWKEVPLSWVIVGGESGPGHRPMKVEWVQSLADQCSAAGVPLFVKQGSGLWPGQQDDLPDSLWARKEMPRDV
mgnify:CR=1 FL=1